MEDYKIKKCSYCGSNVEFRDSDIIYGKSYGMVYICSRYPECNVYVGVHEGTTNPLGTLANAELREWRKKAHSVFDELWESGKMTRKAAYTKLMIKLGLRKKEAHIAKMSVSQCKRVVAVFGDKT